MQKLNIIALMGKSKSGKDTSGKMLTEMGLGVSMAFADKLKAICGEMFNLTHEQLYDEKLKELPTEFTCLLCPECKSPEVAILKLDRAENGQCKVCGVIGDVRVFRGQWTPRTILQFIGTEGFRRVDPSVWVRYAIDLARRHLEVLPPHTASNYGGRFFVVITDCRFKSEMEAIHAVGGEVWRIRRPEIDGAGGAGLKGHASEQEMDSIPDSAFQATIKNDSTLDVLRGRLAAEFGRFKKDRSA